MFFFSRLHGLYTPLQSLAALTQVYPEKLDSLYVRVVVELGALSKREPPIPLCGIGDRRERLKLAGFRVIFVFVISFYFERSESVCDTAESVPSGYIVNWERQAAFGAPIHPSFFFLERILKDA